MIDKEEFTVIHTLLKRGCNIRAISKRLKEKELKPKFETVLKVFKLLDIKLKVIA